MASYLDKFKLTTALDTNTTMDLSCTHITTSDWMHCAPTYIKELVPGESIKIHQETFTRLAPMSVPTFGRGLIHNRAFFVPFRTIFDKWNEFITAADVAPSVVGLGSGATTNLSVNRVPTINNEDLVRLFCIGTSAGTVVSSTTFATLNVPGTGYDPTKHDILLLVTSGANDTFVGEYTYDLTNAGRRLMKVLQSLGYNILWQFNTTQATVDAEYSALPLMAYLKVICDWYYPSQYVGDSAYTYVQSILTNRPSSTGVYRLSFTDLSNIFRNTKSPFNGLVNYDSDYFVSAFDYPNSASEGDFRFGGTSPIVLRDINYYSGSTTTNNGQVFNGQGSASPAYDSPIGDVASYRPSNTTNTNGIRITQYGLDALKALTDYMKRHQLVGARALDRFYARFGKSLDSAKMDRSYYIGADNIPLQIGDVMSHADTTGATLGDYAGKGIGFGANGNFEFTTDEYGVIVIVTSIVPQVGYYQGIDRNVLHTGRLDYWTPEFDQIGNQAIVKKELYLPMNVKAETTNLTNASDFLNKDLNENIFGYTPRYAEYKIGHDRLTGDYRLASKNVAGDVSNAWHLMRNIGDYAQTSANLVHSIDFVKGFDYAQYNRIFNNTQDTADKFYLIHTFNVESQAPMHSLYDTYKFENEDEGAKKVLGDVNGVKVN